MRTKTNPAFYAEQLRLLLADAPERLERLLSDPDSVDLLTWNVFSSLDTHRDGGYLAYRLQGLAGTQLVAPVRVSLWTGRDREPLLRPSSGYVAQVRERARAAGGDRAATAELEAPIEVPVRIESADVIVLVDTSLATPHRGPGGRDRVVELLDAGLDHARRMSKTLVLAFVHGAGPEGGGELSARLAALREPAALAAALPYRSTVPPVVLRESSWQQLLQIWEQEIPYLELGGQPARAFLDHVRARGLL